jgi:hypothetical protein
MFEPAWSLTYVFCEYLNLLLCIASVYLTDVLLGSHFWSYGIDLIEEVRSEEPSFVVSSTKLFPSVTKCDFYEYGAGGSLQLLSTLCVLPMNVVNEKVFVFLWFWYGFFINIMIIVAKNLCFQFLNLLIPRYFFLTIATGTFLIYRTATLLSFRLRRYALQVSLSGNIVTNSQCTYVLERLGIKGWVLLRLLSLNLEPKTLQLVTLRVYDELILDQEVAKNRAYL